jgi:hypothetical protein
MVKRVPLDQKTTPKQMAMTTMSTRWSTLFGQPLLLVGEDGAAYDELVARMCSAVKPVDVIDEMLVADAVSLEWDVLRWRRLKWSLIRARGLEALQKFLDGNLDYDLYSDRFADHLAQILRDNLPEDEAEDAQKLAGQCAMDETEANDKVCAILANTDKTLDDILNQAETDKVKELVQGYVAREPDVVTLIDEFLADNGVTPDSLLADALADNLDQIERIDRLTTIAEGRRNTSLHEIERRRAALGAALRRSVQEIEASEFEVIDTPPAKGKDAA